MKKIVDKIFLDIFSLKKKYLNNNLNSKNLKTWDSLNHVRLIVALEKQFKTKIKNSDIIKLNSIKKIYNYFKSR